MRIPETKIDEIIEQTDIFQLIDEVVPLKKRQATAIKVFARFIQRKLRRLMFTLIRGIFTVSAVERGGNSISFVMKYHNLSFPDAIIMLAERCGVTLEYDQNVSQDAKDIVALHEELILDSRKFFVFQRREDCS